MDAPKKLSPEAVANCPSTRAVSNAQTCMGQVLFMYLNVLAVHEHQLSTIKLIQWT